MAFAFHRPASQLKITPGSRNMKEQQGAALSKALGMFLWVGKPLENRAELSMAAK